MYLLGILALTAYASCNTYKWAPDMYDGYSGFKACKGSICSSHYQTYYSYYYHETEPYVNNYYWYADCKKGYYCTVDSTIPTNQTSTCQGMSNGVVAGITIGSIVLFMVVVGCCVYAIFVLDKKRKRDASAREEEALIQGREEPVGR